MPMDTFRLNKPSGTSSLQRVRTTTVALVVSCQGLQALTFGGIALFLPLIREDLNMSFLQAGMLSAASTLTYALGQIPAGFLSDRYGSKRLFFIGALGTMALMLSFAFIHAFWAVILNQLVAGAFRALLFAPGLTLVTSWFPPERRATAMGFYTIGSFAGNIVLSVVAPVLMLHYGWRFPFIVFAGAGMVIAFLHLIFSRENPAVPPKKGVSMRDALNLFKYKFMWVCAAIQFVRLGVVGSFNFWLPSYLVADRGMSIQAAGWVVGMCAVVTVISNTLGGYVSDRLKNPPLVIGFSLAVLACTSTLMVLVDSIPMLLLIVAINSIFVQFYFGPLFLVPVEVLGQRIAGTATGFSNLFANLGSLAFAYALGVVKDHSGTFTWGFFSISITCLVGIVFTVFLAGMRTRALEGQDPSVKKAL